MKSFMNFTHQINNSIQFNSIYLHSIDPARITIVLTDVEIVIISINYLVKETRMIWAIHVTQMRERYI